MSINIQEHSIDDIAMSVYDLRYAFIEKFKDYHFLKGIKSKNDKNNLLDSWTNVFAGIFLNEGTLSIGLTKKILLDNINNFNIDDINNFNEDSASLIASIIKEEITDFLKKERGESKMVLSDDECERYLDFSKFDNQFFYESFILHAFSDSSYGATRVADNINNKTNIYSVLDEKGNDGGYFDRSQSRSFLSDAIYAAFKKIINENTIDFTSDIQLYFLEIANMDISAIKNSVYQNNSLPILSKKKTEISNPEPSLRSIKLNRPSMS